MSMVAQKIEVKYFHDTAEEIKRLDEVMKEINNTPLKSDTIVVLLQHLTGENKSTIRNVIAGLTNMGSLLK